METLNGGAGMICTSVALLFQKKVDGETHQKLRNCFIAYNPHESESVVRLKAEEYCREKFPEVDGYEVSIWQAVCAEFSLEEVNSQKHRTRGQIMRKPDIVWEDL